MHAIKPERTVLDGAQPLFLIGAPRSGTTILANLLNAHREVLLTHETAVFLQLDEMIKKSRIGGGAGILFGKTYNDLWATHLREQARDLIETFYARIAMQEKKRRLKYWGEKHPHLERCLPWLEELYPNATYIHAIRDPRDTACSIAQMNGIAINDALNRWTRFAEAYEAFVGSITPDRINVVKYEDLVLDYETVVCDALAALGLVMDDSARTYLAKHKNKPSHNPAPGLRIDYWENSVSRWRNEMTSAEQSYALTTCRPFLLKYGYLA